MIAATDVGVVLAALGLDEFRLAFVGHERDTVGHTRQRSRQIRALAGEDGRKGRLA